MWSLWRIFQNSKPFEEAYQKQAQIEELPPGWPKWSIDNFNISCVIFVIYGSSSFVTNWIWIIIIIIYKVNLVGKNSNANSVKVLASGDRDGFKSLTLRKLKRSNQSRISVADLKYLSLPKRSWRIKHLYIMETWWCWFLGAKAPLGLLRFINWYTKKFTNSKLTKWQVTSKWQKTSDEWRVTSKWRVTIDEWVTSELWVTSNEWQVTSEWQMMSDWQVTSHE